MSGKLVMVLWLGFLNYEYGFNFVKKDIFLIKNYEYIYYFDMIFIRDKLVFFLCNIKVDDFNFFIW